MSLSPLSCEHKGSKVSTGTIKCEAGDNSRYEVKKSTTVIPFTGCCAAEINSFQSTDKTYVADSFDSVEQEFSTTESRHYSRLMFQS
jgi:hypothetical protein